MMVSIYIPIHDINQNALFSMPKNLLKSSLLSSLIHIVSKSLGLVSTLVMARIVTPEDFAVVAIVSMVLYFFDIVSEAGSEQYVIQKKRVEKNDLNTAWTLDIITKLVIFVFVFTLSPFISEFWQKPQLEFAIQVAALSLLIYAAKHPKIFMLKRQLNYTLYFKLSVSQKVVGFLTLLPSAFIFKNYWAFILADLISTLYFTIVSHTLLNGRIRLSLVNLKYQIDFTKWLLGKNIFGYIRSQLDTLFVSKLYNAAVMGNYYLARDLSMLPAHSFIAPALEPLLASFRETNQNNKVFVQHFINALFFVSLVSSPIALFVFMYSDNIVLLLLGEQWQSAGRLLGIMIFLFYYWVFFLVSEKALIAMGKIKTLFIIDCLSLSSLFVALVVIWQQVGSIDQVAKYAVFVGVVFTFISFVVIAIERRVSIVKLVIPVIIPAFLALISSLAVKHLVSFDNLLIKLVIAGVLYLTIYTALCLFITLVLPNYKPIGYIKNKLGRPAF